jgi:hypothetical protein
MTIFGVSIILLLGIVNFILLMFQLLSGMHVIKAPFRVHKFSGIALVISAALHGILAIYVH